MSTDSTNYGPIIESWVRRFFLSMDSNPHIGDRSGDEPPGVKIIFDGYGYNEETDEEDDTNTLTFAVFVHKDSLSLDEFPEHEDAFGLIKHRLGEEVCIHCFLERDSNLFDYNEFEDSDSELDDEFVYKLIFDLDARYKDDKKSAQR
jgi:hypothetical protein